MYRLNQIEYRAGKLIAGLLYFTSKEKFNFELSLEELFDSAKFLGLNVFHKIHLNVSRPLVKTFMQDHKINTNNTRTSTCYVWFHQKAVSFSN